jgi:hypothetical protein
MLAREWLGSTWHRVLLCSGVCAAIGFATAALAEPPPPEAGNWDFAITPYIWLPAMTGEAAVKGRSVEIDTTVGDLFTETDFVFAVQAEFAAWYKQRFGMIFNGQWMALKQDDNSLQPGDGPPFSPPGGGPGFFPVEFDLKNNMGFFEFLGGYRVGTWELGSGAGAPTLSFEPVVGLRVNHMRIKLKPEGNLEDLAQSKTWVDPILGGRLQLAFGPERHWQFKALGDVGGFGAGSDLAWNIAGLLGYEWRFKKHDFDLALGIRALSIDYEDGSGDAEFKWDVIQWGPVLALGFKF